MSSTFFSLEDTAFKDEILRKINHRSSAEVVISVLLYFNMITILAIALAANGLGIPATVRYLIFAFSLILCSAFIEIYAQKLILSAEILGFLEALSLSSALFFNNFASDQVSTTTAVINVCVVTFLSLPISVRSFIPSILNKGSIIFFCIIYAFLYGDDTTKMVYLIFPLIIIFFMIAATTYWLYIRKAILIYQQIEANRLKNLLNEKNISLKEARNRLKHEHEIRNKLIRHIGHDLRQPINTLNYSLFNIDKVSLDYEQRLQIDIAQKSIDTANYLIEDILQISTYQKHDIEANNELFLVQELFNLLNREYQNIVETKGMKLSIVPCSAVVKSDVRLISRIIRNFLSNAIRHSQTKKIVIGARRRSNTIDIQVIDQGIGINKDKQKRLFKEYPNVNHSKDNGHLGLGLSIAKNLAKACHATISINTIEGRGTLCSLTLSL